MHFKMIKAYQIIILILISIAGLSQCVQSNPGNMGLFNPSIYLYVDQALPTEISRMLRSASKNILISDLPDRADIRIGWSNKSDDGEIGTWYYAVCVPFYTIRDTISFAELKSAWKNAGTANQNPGLIITDETKKAMNFILGMTNALIAEDQDLPDELYEKKSFLTIVPFHNLKSSYKVLELEGRNILQKDADLTQYPLTLFISARGKKDKVNQLKKIIGTSLTNRDPAKMTVITMTGTTALTRQTAFYIEKYGIDFPAKDVGEWLKSADITHISNEVSFYPDCVLNFSKGNMLFCSSEKYLALFDTIGVDVIELSGNHLTDFGTKPLLHTLDLFEQKGYRYYAGGRNITDAMKPVYIESGPNRIAFIGACAGPSYHFADTSSPGPLKVDWDRLKKQISALVKENWLPIVTIQFFETYEYFPTSSQVSSFRSLADCGAVIVQGSQAHQPQSFDFHNGTFIHYGLGNLFFDQMWSLGTRQEFIDRHIFYNGKHISTVLQTAMLEDYCRPRPMTSSERKALLESTFSQSFWHDQRY
jgi:hypothetical protein